MPSHSETIAVALQNFLKSTEGRDSRLTGDPEKDAVAANYIFAQMMPLIMFVSGGEPSKASTYMDDVMTMILHDFKKAVVEETIKSGAQDQLDEILRKRT